jgi:hypothetical protein
MMLRKACKNWFMLQTSGQMPLELRLPLFVPVENKNILEFGRKAW